MILKLVHHAYDHIMFLVIWMHMHMTLMSSYGSKIRILISVMILSFKFQVLVFLLTLFWSSCQICYDFNPCYGFEFHPTSVTMTLAYICGLDSTIALVLCFKSLVWCWESLNPRYVVTIFWILTKWPQLHFGFWHIQTIIGSNWLHVLHEPNPDFWNFMNICNYFLVASMYVNVKYYFSSWSYPAFSDLGIYIQFVLAVKACIFISKYF